MGRGRLAYYGPVIDYLAKCDSDDNTAVIQETLKYLKLTRFD